MASNAVQPIYAEHHNMLRQVEIRSDDTALVRDVKTWIEQVRRTGETISALDERDYLQSLLTFWGNWVYQQTRVFPNIDLYPPPAPPELVLRPPAFQMFAAPQSQEQTQGIPFIMANIVQPTSGTEVKRGETVTLQGTYTNLQPDWRVFFIGQMRGAVEVQVLHSGFTPPAPRISGTWLGTTALQEAGVMHLGILIGVTPDAATAIESAYNTRQSLRTVPLGAVALADLCLITIVV